MGNLTSQTDANGQVTTLFYDGLNRLVGKSFSTGDSPITYTYDENGHTGYRTSMTDASGETHWQYDTRGRMTEEAKTILNQGTYTTQWVYDSQDRVKHMFYPNGERVKFSYNKQGDVAGLENNHTKILTNRIMDNHGRIIKQIYGNGTSTTYSYDQWLSGAGRLMTLNTKKRNDEVLQELSYSYDPIGNITQLNNMGETLNFSYDALSRLTGVSGAYEEKYSYDIQTGNLSYKTGPEKYHYTSGKPHAVTGYGSEPNAFEYDANGQMVKRNGKNISYDAQGKLISYDGKSHVYDGDGNRVMMDNGDGKVTVYIGNYYERLMERMDDIGPVDPPVTRNGGQEYTSYFPVIGNGETVDYETHRGQTYYYAGSSRIATRTEIGEVIWLYGDHLGSTSVTADRHGNELSCTKYYAWGTTWSSTGDTQTDYAYTGQMKVDDIYYYNARWYDPTIGRFMQADTLVPGHQGTQAFDRYAYVNNNPLKYTDPSGNVIVVGEQEPGYYGNKAVYSDTHAKDLKFLIAQFEKAIAYLKTSPAGKDLIEKLESTDVVITVMFISNDKNRYNPTDNTVYFNPNCGLVLKFGSTQSPALVLAHEFAHAIVDIEGISFDYSVDYFEEEAYVISNYETPIARQLGEPVRDNYHDVVSTIFTSNSTQFRFNDSRWPGSYRAQTQ